MLSARRRSTGGWTTRRFALDRAGWVTSAVAASVPTSAYVRHGGACLAPGVVGELVGFGVLSQVLRGRDARLRNEAAVWLTCIGLVTASAQRSGSRRVPEPLLWAAFAAGLATYLQARQRTCR